MYHGEANLTATGDTMRLAGGSVGALAYRFFTRTDGKPSVAYTEIERVERVTASRQRRHLKNRPLF